MAVGSCFRRRYDVRHEAQVAGGMLAGRDMARADGRVPVEHREDFTEFDALTAHLHLPVRAADKVNAAIGPGADEIARFVEPRVPASKGFGMNFSAVRVGRLR